MPLHTDTIYALSSGRLPAAIAIVRISGSRAGATLEALIGSLPEPRLAKLARVRDPSSGEAIDDALALWFPGPQSETGEDVAEIQLHGGRAVLAATLDALAALEGLRPAEGGEFTRRAFENGKLDLTAVEGLADLIGAETQAQRKQAYRQLKGVLGNRAEGWRTRLIEAQALIEAGIDFADEDDVPETLLAPAVERARGLACEIAGVLAQSRHGERVRDGFVVAIAGPPNAGKSTLLNRIAQRDVAIVSPHAGTTRDVIEVHLDLGGYPVTLLDTAGVRATEDPVEQEGVRRALERASGADLVLWVTAADQHADGGAPKYTAPLTPGGDDKADAAFVPRWSIRNKGDLDGSNSESSDINNEYEFNISLSALTGEGVGGLLDALHRHVRSNLAAEPGLVTRQRHRLALTEVLEHLSRVQAAGIAEEIAAEELRLAARALGRLTGRVDIEDILDVIFRDFCVGK